MIESIKKRINTLETEIQAFRVGMVNQDLKGRFKLNQDIGSNEDEIEFLKRLLKEEENRI